MTFLGYVAVTDHVVLDQEVWGWPVPNLPLMFVTANQTKKK